jgi:mannose-6-phosphate isomerase-like protein (cupin superfamily)
VSGSDGPRVRVVVTGFDAKGRSCIESDRCLPADQTVLWVTDPLPPVGETPHKLPTPRALQVAIPAGVGLPTFPPPGATRFAIVSVPPDRLEQARLGDTFDEDSFGMHQTQTIDYVVIVRGELWLRLEHAEVHLRAGDCVVQRGTKHAWRNYADEQCIFAAAVIGALPTPTGLAMGQPE